MPSHCLQISSGVGPLEARRFVALLAEYLEGLALERGLLVDEVVSVGEAEAPRSVTLLLRGSAAAALAELVGSHELVHRFDTRGKAARKRWFAAVTLHEEVAVVPAAAPPREELEITACRAGGPGGQHVNKVATAVRVHHRPSGLAVRCASERSQRANLERALARLGGLLAEQQRQAERASTAARRLEHYRVVRGGAVASYALDREGQLARRSSGAS